MEQLDGTVQDTRYAPDDKGREHVHTMTDRELLEEVVTSIRTMRDLVDRFIDDFQSGKINPMSMLTGMMKRGK